MIEKINVRAKGQMTLPVHARQKLGVETDSEIYMRETEDGFELISEDRIQDVAAGALAKYARFKNPDSEEERAWVGRSIAESGDSYE